MGFDEAIEESLLFGTPNLTKLHGADRRQRLDHRLPGPVRYALRSPVQGGVVPWRFLLGRQLD
jgi:hypothetical protein